MGRIKIIATANNSMGNNPNDTGEENHAIHRASRLATACATLAKQDKHMALLIKKIGVPPPKPAAMGFAAFIDILISQQISSAAAASISKKFMQLVGEITPANILAQSVESLRTVGLSRQKIERVLLLSAAAEAKIFLPETLPQLSTDEVVAAIMAQKGFGRWSGEIYALFSLGRMDVFPSGDLALQLGHHHLYKLPQPLSAAALATVAESWRPHRGVAALLLWEYYNMTVKAKTKSKDKDKNKKIIKKIAAKKK